MTEKKQVYSAFRKAEQHMIMALKARKGEIKVRHSGQDSIAVKVLVCVRLTDILTNNIAL